MANKEKQANRKHIVGLAREKLYSRGLTIATGAILALVVGLVGWGLIQENFIKPNTIVAIVEGKEINGEEFANRVRVNRQQLVTSYLQNIQDYQLLAGNAGLQQQVLGQMNLIQDQLEDSQVGLTTINQIVDDELIVLEAQKLGIKVNDEEVEKELQSFFSYFPSGTPTEEILSSLAATSTLSAVQYAIISVTPTATAIPTSDFSTLVPTGTLAATGDANATATSTTTPEPRSTPFTEDAFEAVFSEYLDIQLRELGLSEDALRQLVKINLFRDRLFTYLTADVEEDEEQVWARHILVEDRQSAVDLLDQLGKGADWAELALEHSLDTNNADRGGDLDWFSFDTMVLPFSIMAFDLSIGEISIPVESDFGWHIIQVLGHEHRPLSQIAIAQTKNEIFLNYISSLRPQYEWEIIEDKWINITPDKPDIPAQYRLSQ